MRERIPLEQKLSLCFFAAFLGAALVILAARAVIDWLQKNAPAIWSTIGPWVIGFGIIAILIGVSCLAWRVYVIVHGHVENMQDRHAQRQLMIAAAEALRAGHNVKMANPAINAILEVSNPYAGRISSRREQTQEIEGSPERLRIDAPKLPTNVRYEDIRDQVPRGHILVGMGTRGVETKEKSVGALVWIVGLSGTGKTSTTVLRVEERHSAGHKFLGIDPHWFKPDSLTNAVKAYEQDFITPMAKTPTEMVAVLDAFLAEFQGRKAGRIPKPWQPITLLVDEVGSLMDPTDGEEEEIKKRLPTIARICGQEARNFEMGGIFISQQATGLAWLRKMALMVIVHQLLMESEKKLALNNDTEAMEAMKSWPIGRTYVFGVGFQEGPRTVQQPYFAAPAKVVDAGPSFYAARTVTLEDLPPKNTGPLRSGDRSSSQPAISEGTFREQAQEGAGTERETGKDTTAFELKKFLNEIGKMKAKGMSNAEILKQYELHPGGRNNTNLGALVEIIEETERA